MDTLRWNCPRCGAPNMLQSAFCFRCRAPQPDRTQDIRTAPTIMGEPRRNPLPWPLRLLMAGCAGVVALLIFAYIVGTVANRQQYGVSTQPTPLKVGPPPAGVNDPDALPTTKADVSTTQAVIQWRSIGFGELVNTGTVPLENAQVISRQSGKAASFQNPAVTSGMTPWEQAQQVPAVGAVTLAPREGKGFLLQGTAYTEPPEVEVRANGQRVEFTQLPPRD